MKRKNFERTKKLLESDRLGFVNGSEEIIRRDLESLLREYFVLTKPVKIKLDKSGDKIKIIVDTECSAVKRFGILSD